MNQVADRAMRQIGHLRQAVVRAHLPGGDTAAMGAFPVPRPVTHPGEGRCLRIIDSVRFRKNRRSREPAEINRRHCGAALLATGEFTYLT